MPGVSAAEQALWQRMTFREFFILMLRLQALLLLFRVVIELTYLLPMLTRILGAPSFAVGLQNMSPGLGWLVLRLLLQVAAAVALISRPSGWRVGSSKTGFPLRKSARPCHKLGDVP